MPKVLEIQPKAVDRCKCGSGKTRCYKTDRMSQAITHRYHVCLKCGRRFKTEELAE